MREKDLERLFQGVVFWPGPGRSSGQRDKGKKESIKKTSHASELHVHDFLISFQSLGPHLHQKAHGKVGFLQGHHALMQVQFSEHDLFRRKVRCFLKGIDLPDRSVQPISKTSAGKFRGGSLDLCLTRSGGGQGKKGGTQGIHGFSPLLQGFRLKPEAGMLRRAFFKKAYLPISSAFIIMALVLFMAVMLAS
jgi:hypothetical protein